MKDEEGRRICKTGQAQEVFEPTRVLSTKRRILVYGIIILLATFASGAGVSY